ncbi:MAG: GNAT family N-acetyltransferase [Clostridia bacterium]|nr:GNAT family N-acetyltransferase [Clostridia bacterium]
MKLIYPDREYFCSYDAAIEKYLQKGITQYHLVRYDADTFFERVARYRTGKDLPSNRLPCTFLWLVEESEFIGEVSIRHGLNDALLRYGGHIGYWVRSTRWNSGVGTQMLAMALDYVRAHFDFERVLITCDDDNIGSARVIEKNGGILENKIENHFDDETVLTRRYWISL